MNRYLIKEINSWVNNPNMPLVLYGAPGVGKKTLAIELLNEAGKRYRIVDVRVPAYLHDHNYDFLILINVEVMPIELRAETIVISTYKIPASQPVKYFRVLPRDHKTFRTHCGEYIYCYEQGGMPRVLYKHPNSMEEEEWHYYELLRYLDHPALLPALSVWLTIPFQLGKKFQYNRIPKKQPFEDFDSAIDWLVQHCYAYRIYRLAELPKEGSEEHIVDRQSFKLYPLDSAISRQLHLAMHIRSHVTSYLENYVLQELEHYPDIKIYYYSKSSSSHDVTFLFYYKSKWKAIAVREKINNNEKLFRSLPYDKLVLTPGLSLSRLDDFMK